MVGRTVEVTVRSIITSVSGASTTAATGSLRADAYRLGKIPDEPQRWDAMRRTLARRCPDLSEAEYDHALNDAFTSSR